MDGSPASDDETLADSGFYWRELDGVKVLVCRPLEDAGFGTVDSGATYVLER